jgi:DHA2 family multidrug resistance protein-like MFS transporter
LLALGCSIAWASSMHAGFALLILGLCVVGAGIAFPYASAPWIALAGLAPTQTGKGSGVLNSCSFLDGTVGVIGGGVASASRGSKAC